MALIFSYIISIFVLAPSLVFGASFIDSTLVAISNILKILAATAAAFAMLAFVWGVIKYVISAENEEQRSQARAMIVYGVISLFVIFSIWGIALFISRTFGISLGGSLTPDNIPLLPGSTSSASGDSAIAKLLVQFGKWIGALVIIVMSFAIVLFFYGVAKYILGGANEEKRREGAYYMLYGVIGIFVMSAVWGLVFFLGNIVGVNIGGQSTVPSIGIENNSGIGVDTQKFSGCAGSKWDPKGGSVSFQSFVCLFITLLAPIPPILVTIALLYFFWGITKYIRAGGNSEELKSGRDVMIYGIIALFVMLAVWGLVLLVQGGLGIGSSDYIIKQSDFDSWGDPSKINASDFTKSPK
jgi:hypothetical protein